MFIKVLGAHVSLYITKHSVDCREMSKGFQLNDYKVLSKKPCV